jgi:DNA-binding IclR family transcriptional regulator
MKKKSKYYQINSIVKVFKIIETLVLKPEWDLAQIAKQTGIQKTTVHRMLLTLRSLGYVEQNPKNKRYAGSISFFEIGCKVIGGLDYIKVAHPYLVELSEKTAETINLCVTNKLDMIVMDRIESTYSLKQDTPLGGRFKSYCSASGKAVLANLDKLQRDELLAGVVLEPNTPKSLKTREELEKDLELTASRGYAIDNEEFLAGLRCVAAPIFNHNKKVIAGLSVSAPTVRLKMGDIPKLAKIVIAAAREISRKLGSP